ncbi:hypothetical protein CVT25_007720 [Psilocybe cyanescens]|uniref:Uncharacterized protein n=1 Tax=Psilocybe cyanescens TaxID=93625 RepID=A0A409XPI7_PSICY|nr:hypothetical protein CVT25_007720 [Psilocybe cyanescens]
MKALLRSASLRRLLQTSTPAATTTTTTALRVHDPALGPAAAAPELTPVGETATAIAVGQFCRTSGDKLIWSGVTLAEEERDGQ